MSKTPHRSFGRARVALLALCASALLVVAEANAATLTIDIDGSSGRVTDWSGAIDCSGPPPTGKCSASFSQQVVQLVLTAAPGSPPLFAGWSGLEGEIGIPEDNCRGFTNPCMVWLAGDRTLTATFGHNRPPGDEPTCMIEPWECPQVPECMIEPWECFDGSAADSFSPSVPASGAGGAGPGSSGSTATGIDLELCGKGKIRRGSQCISRRALARRACDKARGEARRRCIRRAAA